MNRKFVSIRGDTYLKIKQYCEENEMSIFTFLENVCTKFFAKEKAKRSAAWAKSRGMAPIKKKIASKPATIRKGPPVQRTVPKDHREIRF